MADTCACRWASQLAPQLKLRPLINARFHGVSEMGALRVRYKTIPVKKNPKSPTADIANELS